MTKRTKTSLGVILRRITKLGSAYVFQPCDGNLWTAEECFLGPEDLEAAAATLLKEFGLEVLRDHHLLEPEEEPAPRLKLEYSPQAGPIIGVTYVVSGRFRLVTGPAVSHSPEEPLRQVLCDRTTRKLLLQREGIVLLTESVEQAAAFFTLGLPAAPVGRLSSLANKPLMELSATFLGAQTTLRKRQKDFDITLVLANWSPLGWSAAQQAALRQQAEFLTQVVKSRSINLGDVAVWDPTPDEQRELDFAVDHGDREEVWTAVRNSMHSSSFSVARFSDPDFEWQQRPTNFVQALAGVQDSFAYEARHGEPDPRRAERLQRHAQWVDHDLVSPVLEQARASKDPLQRSLLACAAETARSVHLQAPEIRRQFALLSDVGSDQAFKRLGEQLALQRRSACDLLQLVKVLREK